MVCGSSGRRALILLLVEGPSDKKALVALAGKVTPDLPIPRVLVVGRGDLFRPEKLKAHVGFAHQQNPRIRKVLACVDSECTPIEETQRQAALLESELQRAFRDLSIKYVVVDHSLEGWLLCDRNAVRKVLGGKAWLPRYRSPENECRPAQLLETIFRRNNRDFIKTRDAPRLADQAKPQHIFRVSDTFKDFRQALLDP